MTEETIDHKTLRHLVSAGAVCSAAAVADGDSWAVVVHVGRQDKTVVATNSQKVRTFRHLDSLVKYLRELGIRRFEADATDYDPEARSVQRPDRAVALKRAHDAAKHDEWFREQVRQGLEEAERGETIPHAEFKRRMERWLTERYGPRP